jgi:hypothetical protein
MAENDAETHIAYQRGWINYRFVGNLDRNSYPIGSEEHELWCQGWKEAMEFYLSKQDDPSHRFDTLW